MENDLTKPELVKIRMQILLSSRQNITQSLMVLIGGVFGVSFMEDSFFKFFLIGLGLFYIFVFIKNLYQAEKELKIIYNMKDLK